MFDWYAFWWENQSFWDVAFLIMCFAFAVLVLIAAGGCGRQR